MARDYALLELSEVRRRDRAVADETWIRALLHRAGTGTLATVFEGQPFINSNLFVYDEAAHAIYMHTAQVGRTRANLESDERVCFSVHEMGRFLPADTALEFSVEYAGVTLFGNGTIIRDAQKASFALQMLLDKYAPHLRPDEHYRPITAEEIARTAVYQITIEQWSGKRKQADPNFPGAFLYPIS